MEMKKIILDTNAYSALAKNNLATVNIVTNAEEIFIPVFVLAELYFGFKNGTKETENLNILAQFLNLPGVSVLQTTEETAQIYGEIYFELKKKGKPIPTNDIWISAVAVESGSVLVTFDKHFLNISKIRVWKELN